MWNKRLKLVTTLAHSVVHMRRYTKKLRGYFSNAKIFIIIISMMCIDRVTKLQISYLFLTTDAFVQQKMRRRENKLI